MKLLLVDDERIIREHIEGLLSQIPDITLTDSCANAFDALESMENNMPDILLTDIKMPQMDGLELIERARKLNPAIQCLVLSGYDEFQFAQKAITLGVREYILKPFYEEELRAALSRICEQISAVRQRAMQRDTRIMELAELMLSLNAEQPAQEITQEQVRLLVNCADGWDVFREAYTYIVAMHETQPARSITAIKKTFDSDCLLLEETARMLNQLQNRKGQLRPFVQRMCDYIDQHFSNEDLSLQYLADHVIHMRADYIGREFTKDMGMKISDYLLQVRMEHAKTMLSQADKDSHIYETADAIGLGHNPQYFARLFRKYTGLTPTEYVRRQNTKQ